MFYTLRRTFRHYRARISLCVLPKTTRNTPIELLSFRLPVKCNKICCCVKLACVYEPFLMERSCIVPTEFKSDTLRSSRSKSSSRPATACRLRRARYHPALHRFTGAPCLYDFLSERKYLQVRECTRFRS